MIRHIRIATLAAVSAFALTAANADLAIAEKHESKAVAFEQKAIRHEAKADELANRKGYNPMAQKWPAMVQGPIDRERQLAAKAREEAVKARELAAKHREAAGSVAE